MARMKDLLFDIVDQYNSGRTISQIADSTGLSVDRVMSILQEHGVAVEE
jgi:hypothetical protein